MNRWPCLLLSAVVLMLPQFAWCAESAAFPLEGLTELGGTCMSVPGMRTSSCGRAIALMGRANDDLAARGIPHYTHLVAQQEVAWSDERSAPIWRVTDMIELPTREGFLMQIGACGQPAKCDERGCDLQENIVALVREVVGQEIWDDVDSAWLLDLDSGRFETLPAAEVSCINDGIDA